MLQGKTVLLGVTGSIAAYKAAALASALKKQHCNVHVVLTEHAAQFITPITFETLTGNKCLIDTFDRNFTFQVEHISLAKAADLIIIAPATANIIAKLAAGIADDMLTTTILAASCPILLAPAMNTAMYENPVTQRNLQTLRQFHYEIIEPDSGLLACNDVGKGKMPEPAVLEQHVLRHLAQEKDLTGKKVLVTAGPTQEAVDPVRFLTNHSTGKMGFALARAAMLRGAEVTLISGPTSLDPPLFIRRIPVTTAEEMYEAAMAHFPRSDYIFKAAAVADYRPAMPKEDKTKKKENHPVLPMERTRDILAAMGREKRPGQILCGFSMETRDLLEHSCEKLEKKHADMIVANHLRTDGAGFGSDTNIVTLITADRIEELPKMDKLHVALAVLDRAVALQPSRI